MTTVVLLVLLTYGSAVAAERPEDFAYGMPIRASAQDALHEIEIPAAVYRDVTRSDLGDIRVFNGQGEEVPHALRPRAVTSTDTTPAVSLPVFPLSGEASDKLEDLSVRIEKRSDGTIVSIRGQSQSRRGQRQTAGLFVGRQRVETACPGIAFHLAE